MIVACDNCSAPLQIDETKLTVDRFNVRCPKCHSTVAVDLKKTQTAFEQHAPRDWQSAPAAAYRRKIAAAPETAPAAVGNANADLLQMLAQMLNQQQNQNAATDSSAQPLSHRRALICLNSERAEIAAPLLDAAGYAVFVAENPAQATEKIRDGEVDLIVYSPDFALKFSGASVIQKMVQSLLSHERRRFFVVSIEEGSPTFNTHEAFLRNLNLIVNANDLHHLPSILHRALRDYNELYKHFNAALESAN